VVTTERYEKDGSPGGHKLEVLAQPAGLGSSAPPRASSSTATRSPATSPPNWSAPAARPARPSSPSPSPQRLTRPASRPPLAGVDRVRTQPTSRPHPSNSRRAGSPPPSTATRVQAGQRDVQLVLRSASPEMAGRRAVPETRTASRGRRGEWTWTARRCPPDSRRVVTHSAGSAPTDARCHLLGAAAPIEPGYWSGPRPGTRRAARRAHRHLRRQQHAPARCHHR